MKSKKVGFSKNFKLVMLVVLLGYIIVSVIYFTQKSKPTAIPEVSQSLKMPEKDYLPTTNLGAISYATVDKTITASKKTKSFFYTATQMKDMAKGCNQTYATNYFENLVKTFRYTTATVYTFKTSGPDQDKTNYTITVLPNKAKYATLEAFKKDFDLCEAGGTLYPILMNANSLVFVNSCTTGVDDGSGKPHGCEDIKNKIEKTIKLN